MIVHIKNKSIRYVSDNLWILIKLGKKNVIRGSVEIVFYKKFDNDDPFKTYYLVKDKLVKLEGLIELHFTTKIMKGENKGFYNILYNFNNYEYKRKFTFRTANFSDINIKGVVEYLIKMSKIKNRKNIIKGEKNIFKKEDITANIINMINLGLLYDK